MLSIDRSGFIELLNRLGAEDDATALAAARELHRHMSETGLSWDDLLLPEPGSDPDAAADETQGEEDAESFAEGEAPFDEEEAEDAADEVALEAAEEPEDFAEAEALSPAALAEDARIVERLLAKKTLSKHMREELGDMKQAIADGEFDAMDSRYVRALNKRLGP